MNTYNIKYRNKEFENLHVFKDYYSRLSLFYGYILGSSLTFILCFFIFGA